MDINAPTKLDMPLQGPFREMQGFGNKYDVMDPISGKVHTVHVTRLRPFQHHKNTQPLDVALRQNDMYIVSRILKHKGNTRKPASMRFLFY